MFLLLLHDRRLIRYKTKATARRALTFIVRISVNDTIAIAVWTCFHVCASKASRASPLAVQFVLIVAAIGNVDRGLEFRHGPFTSVWHSSITEDGKNRHCHVDGGTTRFHKNYEAVGGVGPNLR